MLPQNLRLKQSQEINKTFKNGLHKKSDHFFYKYIKTNTSQLKFCITNTKKLRLNKPQRNTLKRQVSNALYQVLKSNPNFSNLNFNIILVLHTIPKSKDYFSKLQIELQNFLNKIQNEQ
jgi:ribonuclease P protein component